MSNFPEHWDLLPLEDVMEAIIDYRGKTPKKTESGVPLITAKIVKNGRIETPSEFIAEDAYDDWMVRGLPEVGDVVVTTEAPLGEVAQLDDSNVALAQRIVTLRGKKDVLDNDFLLFLMQSKFVQEQLEARASGSTVRGIKQSELRKVTLVIPPVKEQIEIANHLKTIDNKIELNRQINQTLEQIAQAIFKFWFVDFEPVKAKIEAKQNGQDPERAAMRAISGKTDAELDALTPEQLQQLTTAAALFPDELENSKLGEMPKGWEWKPLYETAEYVNGASFKSKDFAPGKEGLPIIKIAELKQGISEGTKFTLGCFPKKYQIGNDDVLYSWSGSPETSLEVFKWFGGDGWLNQHIFKLNFTSIQQKYFSYFLLKYMKPELIRTAQQKQTTGLGHVTVADMKRIKVVYPSGEVILLFSEMAGPLYENNSLLQKEIRSLSEVRDLLLPKLLSGELTTGNTQSKAEAVA